jgi:hypothetical protein
MADETTRAPKADAPGPTEAAKDAAKAAADKSDDAYDRERLIDEAYVRFGQPSHVVAGAITGINKKTLTEAEVTAAIKAFLTSEVK